METWINGASGSDVKRIIDNNFDALDKRTRKMNEDILSLNPLNKKTREFTTSDWAFAANLKTYTISIPYAYYNSENPCVEVYIKNGNNYSLVYDGYTISESGIVLQSDISYEGKVVIR